MSVLHITNDNFEREVLNSDKTVIIDFWASWCNPCRMLAPIFEAAAAEAENVKFCKVNVDEQSELAQRFEIMSIPTMIVFKNGAIAKKSVGGMSKDQILKLVED